MNEGKKCSRTIIKNKTHTSRLCKKTNKQTKKQKQQLTNRNENVKEYYNILIEHFIFLPQYNFF